MCALGENHHSAKLTPRQVREIRSLYPAESIAALTRRYRVNRGTIIKVVNRLTWKRI